MSILDQPMGLRQGAGSDIVDEWVNFRITFDWNKNIL